MPKWIKPSYDERKMEEKILLPHKYLLPLGVYGFLYTKLPEVFDYWLRIPKDKLEAIKQFVMELNGAFAMQDDLQDDSLYRRTQPSAHNVFGKSLAINSCIHQYFLLLKDIINLAGLKGAELYCKSFITFLNGQGTSTYWRDHQCDITPDDYIQMAVKQTGFYIVFIVKFMQLFSDNKTDYVYLAQMFGIYYQIRDEYADLKKPEAVEEGARILELQDLSKLHFCEDFTDGKMSMPIVQAMKSKHRDVILGILKMRTHDIKVKEYLLSLVEEGGGIQKTRDILRELEADILSEIRRLGGNPLFEDFMRDMQTWDERV